MIHITSCFAVVNWNELINERHFVKRLYIEGCLILKNEVRVTAPWKTEKIEFYKSLSVKNLFSYSTQSIFLP